jgi:branched-chain amino acid transport system ATP-binding protein
VLSTQDLTIRFGGHVAVNAVSCSFEPGTLTAIVGPNGAGKTTYFNLISGQIKASAGRVKLNGVDISDHGAPARAKAGLGRAFQLTNLFPNLTVRENIRLAVLDAVALGDKGDAFASSLPHGDQRKLEVGILMALEPQVFMFDEPTAGMSVDEAPVILNLIRKLKADRTKTILLVEHKMDVVRELSDRIIVLHNGELVADGDPAAVIASPVVQQAYLGINPEEVDA